MTARDEAVAALAAEMLAAIYIRSRAESPQPPTVASGFAEMDATATIVLDAILANPDHRAALLRVLLPVEDLAAAMDGLDTFGWLRGPDTNRADAYFAGKAAAILARLTTEAGSDE